MECFSVLYASHLSNAQKIDGCMIRLAFIGSINIFLKVFFILFYLILELIQVSAEPKSNAVDQREPTQHGYRTKKVVWCYLSGAHLFFFLLLKERGLLGTTTGHGASETDVLL